MEKRYEQKIDLGCLSLELQWHLGVWGLVVDTVRCMYKVIGNAMLQVCEGEI